jgi:hypothetical protein
MFSDFSRYLVASCWKKMRKRVTHWTSLGFLYILGKLDEAQLQKMFDDHHAVLQTSPRTDTRLFEELHRLSTSSKDGVDMLSQIMQCYPMSASEPQSTLKPERMIEALGQLQGQKQTKDSLGAYTKDTCYEFHQLLIATIFCYGRMLRHFNLCHGCRDKKGCELLAHNILQVSTLLWRIAYSRMLFHHLSLLQAGAFLDLPTQASEYHYRAYATTFVHQTRKKPEGEGGGMKPSDNLGGKSGNEAVGARQDHVHDGFGEAAKGGTRWDETGGEAVDEQGSQGEGDGKVFGAHGGDQGRDKTVGETVDQEIDEEMDEEFRGMIKPIQSPVDHKVLEPGRALTYQRGIRLLVSHWAALEVITAHATGSSDEITIGLLSAKHPDAAIDGGMGMNHWESTIRGLDPSPVSL